MFQRAKGAVSGADEDEEAMTVRGVGQVLAEIEPEVTEPDQGKTVAELPEEPAIAETRNEITGLMAKIRVLSSQFRNGSA
jgi:hypothetical protein